MHLIILFECTLFYTNYPKDFFINSTSLLTKLFWAFIVSMIFSLFIYSI